MVQLPRDTVDCTGHKMLAYLPWNPQVGKSVISQGWGFIVCSPSSPTKIVDDANFARLYGVTGLIEGESIQKNCYGIQLEVSDPSKALSIFSLACGLSIIEKAALELGDTIVVAGANILALKIIEAAILQGAKTVCLVPDAEAESIYLPVIQKIADKVIRFQFNDSFDSEFEVFGKSVLGKTIYVDAVGIPTLIYYMATRLKMFDGLILCRQDSAAYFPLDIYRDIHRKSARIHYWNTHEELFDSIGLTNLCRRAEKLYEYNRILEFV